MEIEIEPSEVFEVSINGKSIGEFKKTSSWEGFVKLENSKGTIIANDDRTMTDKMFEGIFPIKTQEKPKLQVVKITPDLIPIDDTNKE